MMDTVPEPLGDRIETSRVERMTAENPPGRIIDSLQRTMPLHGPGGVMGTGGVEPAMVSRDEGGDDPLVEADQA